MKKFLSLLLSALLILPVLTFGAAAAEEAQLSAFDTAVVYVEETFTGTEAGTKDAPYKTIANAVNALGADGGTVVIMSAATTDNNNFGATGTAKTAPHKFTSVDPANGTDYRTSGAKLTTTKSMYPQGDLYLENLVYDNSAEYINAGGNKVFIGEGVTATTKIKIRGIRENVNADSTEIHLYNGNANVSKAYAIGYGSAATYGDASVYLEGGKFLKNAPAITFGNSGTAGDGNYVGGNANIIVNDADSTSVLYANFTCARVDGAVNVVFNNGTMWKIQNPETNISIAMGTVVPAKGTYYIDSTSDGYVVPLASTVTNNAANDTHGKFVITTDKNYICVTDASENTTYLSKRADNTYDLGGAGYYAITYVDSVEGESTVSFDLNGGIGTVPAPVTGIAGDPVDLPAGTGLSKVGYTFLGWSETRDGEPLSSCTFGSTNKTLYAVWEAGEAVTVFYVDGSYTGTTKNGAFDTPYTDLKSAFNAIGNDTGVIVLKGSLTHNSTTAIGIAGGHVTITSVDPVSGTDYRTSGAVLVLSSSLYFGCDTTFENITFQPTKAMYFNACGNKLVIGKGTAKIAASDGTIYQTTSRGGKENVAYDSTYTEIWTGNSVMSRIYAGTYGTTAGINGDSNLVINGGSYSSASADVVSLGNSGGSGTGATNFIGGNANIIVNDIASGSKLKVTATIASINGAVNYVFNNGTYTKLGDTSFFTSPTPQKGTYFIGSTADGYVVPLASTVTNNAANDTHGKFVITTDKNYICVTDAEGKSRYFAKSDDDIYDLGAAGYYAITYVDSYEVTYTVTYAAEGAQNVPAAQTKTEGEDLTLCTDVPTLAGAIFKNWLGSDGKTYNPGDAYTTDADVTLTAQWASVPSVKDAASLLPSVQAKKTGSSAIMRFIWQFTNPDNVEIENIGAYMIPYVMIENSDLSMPLAVTYTAPAIHDGETYQVDLTDIPEEAFDVKIFAVPFVNGELIMDAAVTASANEADINK